MSVVGVMSLACLATAVKAPLAVASLDLSWGGARDLASATWSAGLDGQDETERLGADWAGYRVQACPGAISFVPDPVTGSGNVAKLTVLDTSTRASCPGQVFSLNPSASLVSSNIFNNGDDRYISVSTLFQVGFPRITNWFQVAEFYGVPYGGSPPIGLDVRGNSLGLWRDRTHGYDNPWSTPMHAGVWERVILRVKFSNDPSAGFVEIWLNGVRQTFKDGSQRLYYATLVRGINWNGSNADHLALDQYRAATPALGAVTVYHGPSRAGTAY